VSIASPLHRERTWPSLATPRLGMPRPTASAPLRVRLYFYFACILQRNTTNPASDRPAIRPRPRAPMAGDNTDAVLKRSKRQSPQPSARRAQQAHAACGKLVRRKREAFHRHCAIHCSCACRHVALEMLWHRCLSHCSRQLFARPPPWAAIAGNDDCIATRRASAASAYLVMRQLPFGSGQAMDS
jgi:hypothetical protein